MKLLSRCTWHRLQRYTLPLCVCSAAFVQPGRAGIFIEVEDAAVRIGQNSAVMRVSIQNTGPSIPLLGFNLNIQVAEGGPELGEPSDGPDILGVDPFVPSSLFAANNNGPGGNGRVVPQLYEVGTLARTGTVLLGPSTTLLAEVELDTSGFEAGDQWSVTLDTLNGPTVLFDAAGRSIPATLVDGTLRIVGTDSAAVPEPAGMAITLAVCLGVLGGIRGRLGSGRPRRTEPNRTARRLGAKQS